MPGYVGLFSCTYRESQQFHAVAKYMIARLCRAFFMHVEVASVLGDTTERDLELIARLCRAFFMHF